MSEKDIEQIRQALNLYCDAVDAATQTLRNNLGKPQATYKPAAAKATGECPHIPDAVREHVKECKQSPDQKLWLLKMQFLGAEKYAQISPALRTAGWTYISAGKETHWEHPA